MNSSHSFLSIPNGPTKQKVGPFLRANKPHVNKADDVKLNYAQQQEPQAEHQRIQLADICQVEHLNQPACQRQTK